MWLGVGCITVFHHKKLGILPSNYGNFSHQNLANENFIGLVFVRQKKTGKINAFGGILATK
jgi:hypothetical protein